MAKQSISQRVRFGHGKQKIFLRYVERILGWEISKIASYCGVHPRSWADWCREKLTMPLETLKRICAKVDIPLPKRITILEPYWYAKKSASEGGIARFRKYGTIGNPEYRKRKWRLWWEQKGKFQDHPMLHKSLSFAKPHRSKKLAEFFGIMLGDGGMSRWQCIVTLHDKEKQYIAYVRKLMGALFKVVPSIYHSKESSVYDIVLSRSKLVVYLNSFGLKIGNKIKQNVDIPSWIKNNTSFWAPCLRGLIDTDGCLIRHRYQVNGKWYFYKKLCFTSASLPLRTSVYTILKQMGFKPRFAQNDIRLDSQEDMKRYFKLIGSHNPKHLKKLHAVIGEEYANG